MIADPLANLRPLTRRSRNLLVHGDGIERYDGKHKLLAAIIGGMLAAGWTVQEAADILCPETRSSFRLVRELQRRYGGRLASEVLGKWRAAERKHARHDELCDRWANVVFWCWPTARYPAVLRVALALARLAKRAGSTTFTASVRELAEAAGVGYASPTDADTKTVRSAVNGFSHGES